ncbi:MAG TPA: VWA domain-containing protein [Blastocatellia bacterium]|nr:VWA domain-containing protein [Blastocatellia bacterium]
MRRITLMRLGATVAIVAALLAGAVAPRSIVEAQSGRQPPKKDVEKKTEKKAGEKEGKPIPEEPQEPVPPVPRSLKDEPPLKLSTQVVNVEVSVVEKKTGRLVQNLTQKNFTVYEDSVNQEITNFRSGEGPATVVLLLENNYSRRWMGNYYDGTVAQQVFQSAATFVQSFVKPEDFVAVVTFSMKPKVIQDFTSDSGRLYGAIMSGYRDALNFSESNVYDALAFALLGGKAIQLYDEGAGPSDYVGLQEVEGRTAVILISLGIDTFSKITYDKALKIIGTAGVPVYVVGVGNIFYKKYEHQWPPQYSSSWQMAFLQLKTFGERSGGAYFPMTFESELPTIMRSIEALLRHQYSIGYVPTNSRRAGKERKIAVTVDVDGDGQPDTKQYELRYRQRYVEPDDNPKK